MNASLNKKTRVLPALLLLCGAAANMLSPSAQAAGVSAGSITDLNGLFGSINFYTDTNQLVLLPTAVADAPVPGLTNFSAIAVGGATSPFAISFDTLTATFTAAPGFKIDSIDFIEVGKFARSGASARTFVGGSLTVNGGAPVSFAPSPANAIGDQDAALTDWSVGGVGSEIHLLVDSTVANVTLSDVLGAGVDSTSGDIAVIFKSALVLTVNASPVPVPPAAWMLGSGLLALGALRGRKTRT